MFRDFLHQGRYNVYAHICPHIAIYRRVLICVLSADESGRVISHVHRARHPQQIHGQKLGTRDAAGPVRGVHFERSQVRACSATGHEAGHAKVQRYLLSAPDCADRRQVWVGCRCLCSLSEYGDADDCEFRRVSCCPFATQRQARSSRVTTFSLKLQHAATAAAANFTDAVRSAGRSRIVTCFAVLL